MLEFNGEQWLLQPGDSTLTLEFPEPLVNLPEPAWRLEISSMHPPLPRTSAPSLTGPALACSLRPFFLPLRQWQGLERQELRVDADWQDAHEYVNAEGEVSCGQIELVHWPDAARWNLGEHWLGDEFHLRFGSRTGNRFVFELEAWLEPRAGYFHAGPAASAGGPAPAAPPNLWLLTEVTFAQLQVRVPADQNDPISWAKDKVRSHLGVQSFQTARLKPVSAPESGATNSLATAWDVWLVTNSD